MAGSPEGCSGRRSVLVAPVSACRRRHNAELTASEQHGWHKCSCSWVADIIITPVTIICLLHVSDSDGGRPEGRLATIQRVDVVSARACKSYYAGPTPQNTNLAWGPQSGQARPAAGVILCSRDLEIDGTAARCEARCGCWLWPTRHRGRPLLRGHRRPPAGRASAASRCGPAAAGQASMQPQGAGHGWAQQVRGLIEAPWLATNRHGASITQTQTRPRVCWRHSRRDRGHRGPAGAHAHTETERARGRQLASQRPASGAACSHSHAPDVDQSTV
jgi:hypothetical protein